MISATSDVAQERHRAIPVVFIGATTMFVVLYDQMFVIASSLSLAGEFGFGRTQAMNLVSYYFVALGSLMIVVSRFANTVGALRLLRAGCVIGAISVGLFVLAPNFATLFVAHLGSAFGAAALIPSAYALVSETSEAGMARDRAFGILVGAIGLGSVAGMLVSGLVADPGWGRIALAVPVLLLLAAALLGSTRLRIEDKTATNERSLQLLGSVLLILSLATLLTCIVEGPDVGWIGLTEPFDLLGWRIGSGTPLIPLLALVSIILWVGLASQQLRRRRAQQPVLVDASLMRISGLRYGVLVLLCVSVVTTGIIAIPPIVNGYMFGTSAIELSLFGAAVSLGIALGALLSSRIMKGFSEATMVTRYLLCLLVMPLLLLIVGTVTISPPIWVTLFGLVGIAMGGLLAALNNLILIDVPPEHLSQASAVAQTAGNTASGVTTVLGVGGFVLTGTVLARSEPNSQYRELLESLAQLKEVPSNYSSNPLELSFRGALNHPDVADVLSNAQRIVFAQYLTLVIIATLLLSGAYMFARRIRMNQQSDRARIH